MIALDNLPADIQYNIFSWLICPLVGHDIERAPQSIAALHRAEIRKLSSSSKPDTLLANHPYLRVAAANRSLRTSIEDYCQHLISVRMAIKSKRISVPLYTDWSTEVAKNALKDKKPAMLRTYRLQYLKWSYECCLFCGKKSTRRAILNQHMWCCRTCDDKEFGKQHSKSEAKKLYKIMEDHFRFPHFLWPELYPKGLDFAYANLSMCNGALMLKDADLIKLSECLKKNKPTAKQMRDLSDRVAQADQDIQKLNALKAERDIMNHLNGMFRKFEDRELEIPLHLSGLKHGFNLAILTCKWHDSYKNAGLLAHWKLVTRWFQHLVPDSLCEKFRIAVTDESDEENPNQVKHQLLVRKEPFTEASNLGWVPIYTILEWPSGYACTENDFKREFYTPERFPSNGGHALADYQCQLMLLEAVTQRRAFLTTGLVAHAENADDALAAEARRERDEQAQQIRDSLLRGSSSRS